MFPRFSLWVKLYFIDGIGPTQERIDSSMASNRKDKKKSSLGKGKFPKSKKGLGKSSLKKGKGLGKKSSLSKSKSNLGKKKTGSSGLKSKKSGSKIPSVKSKKSGSKIPSIKSKKSGSSLSSIKSKKSGSAIPSISSKKSSSFTTPGRGSGVRSKSSLEDIKKLQFEKDPEAMLERELEDMPPPPWVIFVKIFIFIFGGMLLVGTGHFYSANGRPPIFMKDFKDVFLTIPKLVSSSSKSKDGGNSGGGVGELAEFSEDGDGEYKEVNPHTKYVKPARESMEKGREYLSVGKKQRSQKHVKMAMKEFRNSFHLLNEALEYYDTVFGGDKKKEEIETLLSRVSLLMSDCGKQLDFYSR